jgi:hypothetical protein
MKKTLIIIIHIYTLPRQYITFYGGLQAKLR